MSDDEKLTGRGGPGRGQGLRPIYDEPMTKRPLRLPPEMLGWLNEGNLPAAEKLRGLIDEADEGELLDMPKRERGEPLVRTSFAMTNEHWSAAARLGGGVIVKGVRRVIYTAMASGGAAEQD